VSHPPAKSLFSFNLELEAVRTVWTLRENVATAHGFEELVRRCLIKNSAGVLAGFVQTVSSLKRSGAAIDRNGSACR
jgi:hypothetical protein